MPELATLARLVVVADECKRRKVEKEKMKSQSRQSHKFTEDHHDQEGGRARRKGKEREREVDNVDRERERTKRIYKMKRLFRWAVVELYKEGCIVLAVSDPGGEVYVDPPPSTTHSSALWKTSTRNIGEDELPATSMMRKKSFEDNYVSDGPPDEEGYVPLTPRFFSVYVQHALDRLSHRQKPRPGLPSGKSKASLSAKELAATTEEIIKYLHRSDGRWERVGEWVVKDALLWLRERGKELT